MKGRNLIIFGTAVAAVAAAAALVIPSMTRLTIQGQAIGLGGRGIYLERSYGSERVVIDSMVIRRGGDFKFKVSEITSDPILYELRCEGERVPLLGRRGERINFSSVGKLSQNYIIDGSDESMLLGDFYQKYMSRRDELREVAQLYAVEQEGGDEAKASEIAKQYATLYNDIKREQIHFIISNKGSIAAIYALAQRLPGDSFLLSEMGDLVYMRTVAESVAQNYPESNYLKLLRDQIASYESITAVFSNVVVRNYPEIELNDMFGVTKRLSEMDGSVILLDFWSAGAGTSNQNNAELREIYRTHHDAGLEVYQVAIDNSKQVWVNAVQSQKLPWTSVSDLKGSGSPVLPLYNVKQIPSNLLIRRDGTIAGRDLYGETLREAIEEALK